MPLVIVRQTLFLNGKTSESNFITIANQSGINGLNTIDFDNKYPSPVWKNTIYAISSANFYRCLTTINFTYMEFFAFPFKKLRQSLFLMTTLLQYYNGNSKRREVERVGGAINSNGAQSWDGPIAEIVVTNSSFSTMRMLKNWRVTWQINGD